jgi:hypothetical protein
VRHATFAAIVSLRAHFIETTFAPVRRLIQGCDSMVTSNDPKQLFAECNRLAKRAHEADEEIKNEHARLGRKAHEVRMDMYHLAKNVGVLRREHTKYIQDKCKDIAGGIDGMLAMWFRPVTRVGEDYMDLLRAASYDDYTEAEHINTGAAAFVRRKKAEEARAKAEASRKSMESMIQRKGYTPGAVTETAFAHVTARVPGRSVNQPLPPVREPQVVPARAAARTSPPPPPKCSRCAELTKELAHERRLRARAEREAIDLRARVNELERLVPA